MKNNSLTSKAAGGFVWKFLEKTVSTGVQFILGIVLANLIDPGEYGIVGELVIFTQICDVIILQGLTSALIQKKNADQVDFSSVFFANLVVSVVLYLILIAASPFMVMYFKEPVLKKMMPIFGLVVIIGGFGAVPNAVLSKALDFKKSFFRNLSNYGVQAVVGITCALMGCGAWSLVWSKLSGTLVGVIVLMITVGWKPSKTFSFARIKSLFSYGSKVLVTNLLNTLFNNIQPLIVGGVYSKDMLGLYQRGQQMPSALMSAVDGSLSEVLFPTLSSVQDQKDRLKAMMRRSMTVSMFLVFPFLWGLIATAKPLIMVLINEKWLPCVPFMQLTCIICMFWPLNARTQALNAMGKSNVTMKVSIISKTMTVIMVLASIRISIYAMMISSIIASSITFWITSYYVNKYIGYSLPEVLKDIAVPLSMSAGMAGIVYCVRFLGLNDYLTLLIQVPLGIVIYLLASKLFHIDSLDYILSMVKRLLNRKKEA